MDAVVNESLPGLREVNETVAELEAKFYATPMVRKLMTLFPRNISRVEDDAWTEAEMLVALQELEAEYAAEMEERRGPLWAWSQVLLPRASECCGRSREPLSSLSGNR